GGTTYLTTAQQWLLPTLLKPDHTYTMAMLVLIIGVWALNLVALLVLWLRGPHTALDLWMMIVMVAWTCDVGLSAALNAKRFDMGFYAGRVYGLAAALFVLVMLLLETRALYVRLASGLAKDRDSAARRAQRVFDTSLDLILVTDPHGKFVEVSGASQRILSYAPEEMIGKSGRDFIYAEDLDATRSEMRTARRGGVTRNFRCRYVNRAGRPVPLVWTGVWSEADREHFFIGRDVTEREAREEQLRQSQKMEAVGQLIAGTDKLLRRTLGEQIEVEAIFPADLWITNVDRSQHEAALVNLCVN